jgi:hypothetical protein
MRSRFVLACALVFATFGCNSTTGPSGPAGTLNLRLTDSPFTDAKAVYVTFTGVRAHRSEGDWTTVPFADAAAASRTCDLKKLQNGADDILGTGPLVAGQYTMIRLVVESAKIDLNNPSAAGPACFTTPSTPPPGVDVTVSSGEVKLNRGFTLTADTATTILLDLDGDGSIHQQGNGSYRMTPVIAIVSVTPQTPPPAQP